MLKNLLNFIVNLISNVFIQVSLFIIKIYKLLLSPYIGYNCRFSPTCSDYAREVLLKYGFIKGSYLAVIRILKCNPWGGSGFDPSGFNPSDKKK